MAERINKGVRSAEEAERCARVLQEIEAHIEGMEDVSAPPPSLCPHLQPPGIMAVSTFTVVSALRLRPASTSTSSRLSASVFSLSIPGPYLPLTAQRREGCCSTSLAWGVGQGVTRPGRGRD